MAIFKKTLLRTLLACATLGLGSLASGANSDAVYQINRNGKNIGHFSFEITEDENRREVAVEMSIKVKFLFLTVYRATHQRHDIWEHNQLVSSVGESQYNQDHITMKFSRTATNCLWEVNGQTQELTGEISTFIPWLMDVDGALTFLSEKGKAEASTFKFIGPEKIKLADKSYEALKYKIDGTRVRELWYDQHERLLRVRYDMGDATIDIELKSYKAS